MAKLVQCEVIDGPRPGYKTVGVSSVEGQTEYLTIEEKFLARSGNDLALPVKIIGT